MANHMNNDSNQFDSYNELQSRQVSTTSQNNCVPQPQGPPSNAYYPPSQYWSSQLQTPVTYPIPPQNWPPPPSTYPALPQNWPQPPTAYPVGPQNWPQPPTAYPVGPQNWPQPPAPYPVPQQNWQQPLTNSYQVVSPQQNWPPFSTYYPPYPPQNWPPQKEEPALVPPSAKVSESNQKPPQSHYSDWNSTAGHPNYYSQPHNVTPNHQNSQANGSHQYDYFASCNNSENTNYVDPAPPPEHLQSESSSNVHQPFEQEDQYANFWKTFGSKYDAPTMNSRNSNQKDMGLNNPSASPPTYTNLENVKEDYHTTEITTPNIDMSMNQTFTSSLNICTPDEIQETVTATTETTSKPEAVPTTCTNENFSSPSPIKKRTLHQKTKSKSTKKICAQNITRLSNIKKEAEGHVSQEVSKTPSCFPIDYSFTPEQQLTILMMVFNTVRNYSGAWDDMIAKKIGSSQQKVFTTWKYLLCGNNFRNKKVSALGVLNTLCKSISKEDNAVNRVAVEIIIEIKLSKPKDRRKQLLTSLELFVAKLDFVLQPDQTLTPENKEHITRMVLKASIQHYQVCWDAKLASYLNVSEAFMKKRREQVFSGTIVPLFIVPTDVELYLTEYLVNCIAQGSQRVFGDIFHDIQISMYGAARAGRRKAKSIYSNDENKSDSSVE